MILIKISEIFQDRESLRKRVSSAWRIGVEKIKGQDTLIATHRKKIVGFMRFWIMDIILSKQIE